MAGAALSVDPRDPLPLYAQLDRGIRAAIAAGRLAPGDRLPTVRQLAVELRINANTVARVYADLERAGVLETRRGVGTFISARPQPAASRARQSDLRRLVTRFMSDLESRGFTVEEALDEIQALRPKGA